MKLIKIPFSAGGLGKTNGCEKAPDKIISDIKEFYLNEEGMLPFFDVEEIEVDNSNIEITEQNIYDKAKEIFHETNNPVFIGGDHSVTYSLVKAFADTFDNPGFIMFDAHPDCCSDFNTVTHEDLLLALVKEGIIKKENIILIGNRNWHKDELKFLKDNNIRYFNAQKLFEYGREDIIEAVMENARSFGALYVSVDIDVLDPAFAPGTGYIEPGGLTTRELLFFLKKLKLLKNLKGVDIVEVNPDKDVNELTSKVAAKLIVEMG